MFHLTICILVNIALSQGGVLPSVPVLAKLTEYDPAPQYTFAYDVQDSITGDSKAHYETRNGDIVQGSYSLIEADGTRRIVDYTADPINGFNAVVNRELDVGVAAPIISKSLAPMIVAPFVNKAVAEPALAPIVTKPLFPASALVLAAPVARIVPEVRPVARLIAEKIIDASSSRRNAKKLSSETKFSSLVAPLTSAAAGYVY